VRRQCLRALRQCGRLLHRAGVHRLVDVGAEYQRLTPDADRALRIPARGFGECTPGGFVVEAVGHAQALVEIALRRRDRAPGIAVQAAEILEQCR